VETINIRCERIGVVTVSALAAQHDIDWTDYAVSRLL